MASVILWVMVQALATIVFVNRYLTGLVLRVFRGDRWDETVDDYEPTVTVVIPMFNEGEAIADTLRTHPRRRLSARQAPHRRASTTAPPTTASSIARDGRT